MQEALLYVTSTNLNFKLWLRKKVWKFSGVFLTSKTLCIASCVDDNLRQAELPYYKKLKDIIEMNYNRQI